VASDRADDREARSRVATRELDDGLARPELARRDPLVHDLAGDPVLLREARVQVLELGNDPAIEPARQPRELDRRRRADDIDD